MANRVCLLLERGLRKVTPRPPCCQPNRSLRYTHQTAVPVAPCRCIDRQAEAVVELIDALGLDKPSVLGWSSGGNICLLLAAFHGDKAGGMPWLMGC